MKQMFAKFPGIIFMDNTYNICSEGYILNAILVEDQDGSGKPVAYCFMRRETKETLEKIIDVFCENNDTSRINVIMVDKDLTEISVLESKIPAAHIQICSFHVLKYFKTKVAKLDLKQDKKSELIQLLHQILYSHDEKVYTERRNRLHNESECFSQYFDDNWHSCREKWVRCYQKNVKNYGNFTNNKIESHNEKIKQYVSRNMHLPESLQNLLKSVKNSYERSAYSKFLIMKTRIDTSFKDDVRNKYATFCVQPGSEIVRAELNKVESIKDSIEKVGDRIVVTSVSDNREHSVDPALSSCSCSVWGNYGLPCRHIFVCRKNDGIDLYDETLADSKWKRTVALNDCLPSESLLNSPVSIQKKTPKKKIEKMSSVEKYLKATEFLKEMASFLSTYGETEFLEKLEYLKQLKEKWMSNETVLLPNNAADLKDTEDATALVHTIVVESGSDIPSEAVNDVRIRQSQTMISDDLSTNADNDCNETTLTDVTINRDEENSNSDVSSVQQDSNSECIHISIDSDKTLDSENKVEHSDPFNPVNIPYVKSRIGRPKGTNKPFWEFSKSKRPLSLKNLKRKCEENELGQKKVKLDGSEFT